MAQQQLTKFDGETWYTLEDVNPYFYSCGHYPEWVVVERVGTPAASQVTDRRGRLQAFGTRAEAQATADRRNDASNASWRVFLDA